MKSMKEIEYAVIGLQMGVELHRPFWKHYIKVKKQHWLDALKWVLEKT